MNLTHLLSAPTRSAWRKWLKSHFKTDKDIWLVYYKKESRRPRISYNDAVEEALCFGWIDSTVKSLDNDRYAQRFSPRNPKAEYSQSNKVRLAKLIREKRVHKDVLKTLGNIGVGNVTIPPDILRAIKDNKAAWANFHKYSQTYRDIRIAFIKGARNRPNHSTSSGRRPPPLSSSSTSESTSAIRARRLSAGMLSLGHVKGHAVNSRQLLEAFCQFLCANGNHR